MQPFPLKKPAHEAVLEEEAALLGQTATASQNEANAAQNALRIPQSLQDKKAQAIQTTLMLQAQTLIGISPDNYRSNIASTSARRKASQEEAAQAAGTLQDLLGSMNQLKGKVSTSVLIDVDTIIGTQLGITIRSYPETEIRLTIVKAGKQSTSFELSGDITSSAKADELFLFIQNKLPTYIDPLYAVDLKAAGEDQKEKEIAKTLYMVRTMAKFLELNLSNPEATLKIEERGGLYVGIASLLIAVSGLVGTIILDRGGIEKIAPQQPAEMPEEPKAEEPKTMEEILNSFLYNRMNASNPDRAKEFYYKHQAKMTKEQKLRFLKTVSISIEFFDSLNESDLKAAALYNLSIVSNITGNVEGKEVKMIGNSKITDLLQEAENSPELKRALINFFAREGALNWTEMVKKASSLKRDEILTATTIIHGQLVKASFDFFTDEEKFYFVEKFYFADKQYGYDLYGEITKYFLEHSSEALRKHLVLRHIKEARKVENCYSYLNIKEQELLISTLPENFFLQDQNLRLSLARLSKSEALQEKLFPGYKNPTNRRIYLPPPADD